MSIFLKTNFRFNIIIAQNKISKIVKKEIPLGENLKIVAAGIIKHNREHILSFVLVRIIYETIAKAKIEKILFIVPININNTVMKIV